MTRFLATRLPIAVCLGVATTVSAAWFFALAGVDSLDRRGSMRNETTETAMLSFDKNEVHVFYPLEEHFGSTVLRTSRNSAGRVTRDSIEIVSSGNGSDWKCTCVVKIPDNRHLPVGAANWRQEFQFGWPCRALWAAEDSRTAGCFTYSQPAVNSIRLWNHSIKHHQSFWHDDGGPHSWKVPIGMLPVGFAVDSAFYAAIWFGVFFVPRPMMQSFRRRRNLCEHCSYSRHGIVNNRCARNVAEFQGASRVPTLCPQCKASIDSDDVNVTSDVAHCRACGSTFRLSSLMETNTTPPKTTSGAWDTSDGMERRIGASTRSPIAFFLVPFMCVWSGFSLGGIYGTQIVSGKFDPSMSLFGLPFVMGTLIFGTITLMAVFGKVEVALRGDDGEIFTGIGNIGWRRRFQVSEFTNVRELEWSTRNGNRGGIALEGARRLVFGTTIPTERRYFVAQSLRNVFRDSSQ